MSFIWKEVKQTIEYETIKEIRDNVDSIYDNIACITHRYVDKGIHYVSYCSTQKSKDWGTHHGTHRDGVKVTDEATNNSSYCSTQNVSAKTTHRSGLNTSENRFYSSSCYTNKSSECKSY